MFESVCGHVTGGCELTLPSPAPLTFSNHHLSALLPFTAQTASNCPCCHFFFPLSVNSRPTTFLSSFHQNDSRLMTYWPTFTFCYASLTQQQYLCKVTSISHWLSVLCPFSFVLRVWFLPVQNQCVTSLAVLNSSSVCSFASFRSLSNLLLQLGTAGTGLWSQHSECYSRLGYTVRPL